MRFMGFQLIGNRLLAGVTSGGTPSSVIESRCTLAGSRTTTHPGANARVPDTHKALGAGDPARVVRATEHQHVGAGFGHCVREEIEMVAHRQFQVDVST